MLCFLNLQTLLYISLAPSPLEPSSCLSPGFPLVVLDLLSQTPSACMLSHTTSSISRSIGILRIARPLARSYSNMTSSFCRVVNASEVAKPFSAEITQQIEASVAAGNKKPKLVGFLCGSKDSPSAVYADWTRKACESVGIDYELRRIADEEEAEQTGSETLGGAADLEAAILEANSDP